MTYVDFTIEQIKKLGENPKGTPVFTADIAQRLAREYGLDADRAAAAVNTAIKRIMDGNLYPTLRHYARGIYYVAQVRAAGETVINKVELARRKYMDNDNGYQTDDWELMLLALTTQCPNKVTIATNSVKGGLRYDRDCDVYVRAPKTKITGENKRYLQFLDILTRMEGALIVDDCAMETLVKYVKTYNLRFEGLLAYAEKYYPKRIIDMIAKVACTAEELEGTAV